MALTPDKLSLSNDEINEADRLESVLDKKIHDEFVHGQTCRIPFFDCRLPKRIVQEIIARYEKVGWSVKHEHDFSSCDDILTFTFKQ